MQGQSCVFVMITHVKEQIVFNASDLTINMLFYRLSLNSYSLSWNLTAYQTVQGVEAC